MERYAVAEGIRECRALRYGGRNRRLQEVHEI